MEDIEKEPENAVLLSKLFSKIFNPSPLITGRYRCIYFNMIFIMKTCFLFLLF